MARGESLWTAAQIRRVERYREIAARWNQLTEREREVLRRMAEGLSNKEIARELA
ncbi:MAG: LuxR C-terminal-related transcriptional regulator [Thermoflexales bacterium]